ncbi:sugar kinase [Actinocatenispora thailandica]|uniref:Sugar kinase n=1 Tax=Actinocatenispora thailandica TaxID=227318 RepID=A0A7R7HXG4_9ACTN|nr:FGGY-family carbohydrate kinase [Actinocatenispora thailandica]BCJ35123.1 sugar kinase [Actinocatenispora thailandica]
MTSTRQPAGHHQYPDRSPTGAAVLGVDIGTASSKGVLVSTTGEILARAEREHRVDRPHPGHVEMDGRVWWREFVELCRDLCTGHDAAVAAVGVSGMGPCTLLTDEAGEPLRPAILYGVDTRAQRQISELTARYGAEAIVERGGSALTSQAVGPKLAWIAEHEPAVRAAARRLFMPSSYLVWRLTGEYLLDHHSASQAVPLYDTRAHRWWAPAWSDLAAGIQPPRLRWSDEVAGAITAEAARITGLPAGIPVITGTIDAWAEAISVDAHHPGDLLLMYGSTMFLIDTLDGTDPEPLTAPPLWGTVGVFRGTRNLAGGMATSGAVTGWLRDLVGGDFGTLTAAAEASGPGANGLVMLPYFAGERTPVDDPRARGTVIGLTLSHTAGDLYRAALEATAFGVRHNIEAFTAAGAPIDRVVAVGGGTRGGLWSQLVSDVTGLAQQVRTHTIGASYGSAYLAARAVGDASIEAWNPLARTVTPRAELRDDYAELYRLYRELAAGTAPIAHALADRVDRAHRPPG